MLPDLSRVSDAVATVAEPRGDRGEQERYFYVMHRVADASFPYAEGAARVVQSGGVAPGGQDLSRLSDQELKMKQYIAAMEGRELPVGYEDSGVHKAVASFLRKFTAPGKGADSPELKGLMAWYYLATYQDGEPALSFASEDELVFRVPESWLEENALACLELAPRMTTDARKAVPPWAFLTALVVPLEFLITDPAPLPDEERLSMTREEVRDLIYSAHVRADPRLRSKAHYEALHASE